jgi:hypothetical protein
MLYMSTIVKCSSNDYKTPFERLHHTKPDVAHLGVFKCGAYVFLPEDVRSNNLSPRSELITFISLVEGTKGYIIMRSPNNIVFTAIQALFDKTLFLKCPNMHCPGYTPVGLPHDVLQGEHNRPLDDENGDYGGDLPNVPVQFLLHGQYQQLLPQQCMMQPPVQPPLPPSDNEEDLEDMYKTPPRKTSPQNPTWEEPTPRPHRLVEKGYHLCGLAINRNMMLGTGTIVTIFIHLTVG